MNTPALHVVGMGWLGSQLAHLALERGYRVTATQRSVPDDAIGGITVLPYRPQAGSSGWLDPADAHRAETDLWVVCLAPGGDNAGHADRIATVCRDAERLGVQQLILISSTGVLGDAVRNEERALLPHEVAPGKEHLWQAEMACMQSGISRVWVVRSGGLMGPGRHPGRFFSGRQVPDPGVAVNMILGEEVAQIALFLRERKEMRGVVHATAPKTVSRAIFYEVAARMGGYDPPIFGDREAKPTVDAVTPTKLISMGYPFLYPDPVQALSRC